MCNGNEKHIWRDLETNEVFIVDALRKFLKGNEIPYSVSDCTPLGAERPMWHFSIFAGTAEAAIINGFLDDAYSRIAN